MVSVLHDTSGKGSHVASSWEAINQQKEDSTFKILTLIKILNAMPKFYVSKRMETSMSIRN